MGAALLALVGTVRVWNAPGGPALEDTIYSTLAVLRPEPDDPPEEVRAA